MQTLIVVLFAIASGFPHLAPAVSISTQAERVIVSKEKPGTDKTASLMRRLVEAKSKAIRSRDTVELQKLLASDYVFTTRKGRTFSKREFIDLFKDDRGMLPNLDYSELEIRFHASVAIVRGKEVLVGLPTDPSAYATLRTEILVKTKGQWKFALTQETPVIIDK